MPRSRFVRSRPRSVWFARGTGAIAVILIAVTVLVPLLGAIGAASGAAWFVRVPFGTITVVVIAGYLLSAGLLALTAISRRGPIAWVLAVAAAVAALVVSLYPAVAAATAGTEQAGDVVPFIIELVTSATKLFA